MVVVTLKVKVYLHRNGKTSGPYSLEQVRQYVKGEAFSDKDLACYDGKKWIQICELPGNNVEKKPILKDQNVDKLAGNEQPKKSYKTIYIYTCSICVFALIILISFYLFSFPENPYPHKDSATNTIYTSLSEEEFQQVVQNAENGDIDSQLELARIYAREGGMGGAARDLPTYLRYRYKWLNKAAESKNFQGMYQLAEFCQHYGDPIEFDDDFDDLWEAYMEQGMGGSRKSGRAVQLYKEVDQYLSKKSKIEKLNFVGLGWLNDVNDSKKMSYEYEFRVLKNTFPISFELLEL